MFAEACKQVQMTKKLYFHCVGMYARTVTVNQNVPVVCLDPFTQEKQKIIQSAIGIAI